MKNMETMNMEESSLPDDKSTSGHQTPATFAPAAPLATQSSENSNQRDCPVFFTLETQRKFWAPIQKKEIPLVAPLIVCFLAFTLTGVSSWHCSYFRGATISFTGSHYGLWTLEDGTGRCQQWDVLFFSYSLGVPLSAARAFSMASMLIGLGLLTTMAQASRIHAVSWLLGFVLLLLVLISLFTSSNYNLWAAFFLFTYVICTLIVRSFFLHPFHRRISSRGHKILAGFSLLCALFCLLTTVVLKSDFCTCSSINADRLEGRDPGDPCDGVCKLGAAGSLMIISFLFWIATAGTILKFGVQADFKLVDPKEKAMFSHYPRDSLTTMVQNNRDYLFPPKTHLSAARSLGTGEVATGVTQSLTEEEPSKLKLDLSTDIEVNDTAEVSTPDGANQSASDLDSVDDRPMTKKLCCDYRVSERTYRERIAFWSFRIMLFFLILMYLFIIIVKVGSRVENTNAAKAPDTSYNFITEEVCALNPLDASETFQTFPTKQDALNAGFRVAHCGACGACSNPEDIKIYVDTRQTIAKTSKKCGVNVVLGDHSDVFNCLEDRIGFSPECTQCWANNLETTAQRCIFTCMTVLFTGFMSENNVEGAGDRGWLNQCLFCDEKLSGPAFVTCSGVARRRLGIGSEIERNPEEICTRTDYDWLNVDWTNLLPSEYFET